MEAITINKLWKMCVDARKKGLGNKRILISNDDEWNGFHECFDGFFAVDENTIGFDQLPFDVDVEDAINNYIILG